MASATRVTLTLNHCQLSETLTVINYHQRIFERERDNISVLKNLTKYLDLLPPKTFFTFGEN